MRENADQKISEYGHFSRNVSHLENTSLCKIKVPSYLRIKTLCSIAFRNKSARKVFSKLIFVPRVILLLVRMSFFDLLDPIKVPLTGLEKRNYHFLMTVLYLPDLRVYRYTKHVMTILKDISRISEEIDYGVDTFICQRRVMVRGCIELSI